jgi:hypothetical protein
VNDPSNILGNVARQLMDHADAFQKTLEKNEPVDNIELPRESSPTTEDNRVIHVDPEPGPFSPPNPLSPKNWPKELGVSLGPSDDVETGSVATRPDGDMRLLSRRVKPALAGNDIPGQPAPLQRAVGLPGIYSGRPMRQWIVPPPIFGRR